MKKYLLMCFVLLAGGILLTGCSNNTLPEGAQTELAEFFQRNDWQQGGYEITSVVKGESDYTDEIYCFTVSPPRTSGRYSYSNFVARRNGLMWQINTIDTEEIFLRNGCDNYNH